MKTAIGSLKIIFRNKKDSSIIIMLDFLLLVSIWAVSKFFELLTESMNPQLSYLSIFLLFFLTTLIYIILLIFAYSFIKLKILGFINSITSKLKVQSEKNIMGFFLMNTALFAVVSVVYLIIGYIVLNTKEKYQNPVSIMLFFVFAAFFYIFINVSHSLFYKTDSIKKSVGASIGYFKNKKVFYIVMQSILILFILYIPYYFAYLHTYGMTQKIVIIVFLLLIYFVLFINRISFYIISEEKS